MTHIDQIAENALPQASAPSAVPCVRRKEPDFVEACVTVSRARVSGS